MTSETPEDSDLDRIEQLEKRVEYLESVIRNSDREQASAYESSQRETREKASAQTEKPGIGERFIDVFSMPAILKDNWLYWIGVGLLLLGVIFLFNYSVEQGWLIPPVRSAFGLLIGGTLFWLGFTRFAGDKIRPFLMGAGIGAFYITGFATFQLYSFISYPLAFSFMIAVTVLSFGTSIRQNSSTLALIGTLGGLATPFMLYRGDGSLLMLMIYCCIIMTGAAAIYQFKEWGSLLWSKFIGGSLVLLVALVTSVLDVDDPLFADRWILQSSLIYMLGLVWVLPVVKELKKGSYQGRTMEDGTPPATDKIRIRENPHIQALALLIPVLAVQFTHGVWSLSEPNLGFLAIIGSSITASFCFPLRRAGFRDLSATHMFSALVLFTQAMFLFFQGNMLLIVVILEALALRYASTRFRGQILSLGSHLLVMIAWLLMAGETLFSLGESTAILNMQAMSEMLVLISTGVFIPIYLKNSKTSGFYQLLAHIGMLAWLAKELTPLDNGQMITSVAWGIYAVIVLIAGFWVKRPKLRGVGMATLLLVVGKLFFVDLSQTSALLRIPLFMGFGAMLLLIGYFLQKYWSEGVVPDSKEG
ncbi:DUF2339 domain-containing protein [Rhodohalobacter sp. 8-1]|uniref:DUF2339 domain-containing protein n=1 Tax=Rhodohalobacter sp. 8-1 TaxID=3131972 RepID=UPI0030EF7DA3